MTGKQKLRFGFAALVRRSYKTVPFFLSCTCVCVGRLRALSLESSSARPSACGVSRRNWVARLRRRASIFASQRRWLPGTRPGVASDNRLLPTREKKKEREKFTGIANSENQHQWLVLRDGRGSCHTPLLLGLAHKAYNNVHTLVETESTGDAFEDFYMLWELLLQVELKRDYVWLWFELCAVIAKEQPQEHGLGTSSC